MNIAEHACYFHDGTVINIEHNKDKIILFLESGWIDPSTYEDKTLLSKSSTLIGKLVAENIKSIRCDDAPFTGVFKKLRDDGEILDLDVFSNSIELLVEWKVFPKKPRKAEVTKIEIEATRFYWENVPNFELDV